MKTGVIEWRRMTLRLVLPSTPGLNNTRWTGRQPKQLEWKETMEEASIRSPAHPPTTANIQLGLWVDHQSILGTCTEPTLAPLILLHSPHCNIPVNITALINYHFLVSRHPHTLTASDTPLFYLIESRMLGFGIAEEDLRIETSYPFNEVTAVLLLNNSRFHYIIPSNRHIIWLSLWCIYALWIIMIQPKTDTLYKCTRPLINKTQWHSPHLHK